MAGSLNGIGGQQQIPLANPYQPGQQAPVRPQNEKTPKANQVQPQGAQTAQTQTTDRNPKDLKSLISDLQSVLASDSESRRGSVVDITV